MQRNLHSSDQLAVCIAAMLLVLCGQLVAPVTAADWPHRIIKGPFVIHADFPLASREPLFSELAQLQSDLQTQLKIGAPREPIHVYLFHDKNSYTSYMRRYFPHITPRRAMFIKSNSPGNVFAYDSPALPVDLRHECTHAILHACMIPAPLWLDEGLAEYFEVSRHERKTSNPHHSKMRPKFYWMKTPSLRRLEDIRSLDGMGAREYRESWAWVHFMLHGPAAANEVLLNFLKSLQDGQLANPISQQLAAFENLNAVFAQHFRRRDLR